MAYKTLSVIAQYTDGGSLLLKDLNNNEYWQSLQYNSTYDQNYGKIFVGNKKQDGELAKGIFAIMDGTKLLEVVDQSEVEYENA